jgi:phosphate/sulfate permease
MAGVAGVGLGAAALVVGAVTRYAVSTLGKGSNVNKIGLILIFAGAIGFVASFILFLMTRSTQAGRTHTRHSVTSDSKGNSEVQGKE